MKLISWNVNGLRAVMRKMDFLSYLKEEDADIICLQETKIQDGQVDLQPEGYHVYWNYAVKKRIFRHGCFFKTRAAACHVRYRNRRA